MKELKYFAITLFFLLSLYCAKSFSQTTLATGDIAIIGLNSDADDEFTLLLLRDITASTSFYITDKGWNDGVGFQTISGDGIWLWTASSAMNAGATIHIKTTNNGTLEAGSLVATPGTVSWIENNGTVISYTGDQVFIYQGSAASPTFITGCTWNVEPSSTSANWDGSAISATTSALPDQLTTGVNAIWLYGPGPTEYDNFRYRCSALSAGTPSALRTAINNINNWDVDLTGTTGYTINPFPCTFNVSNPCTNPTVPTVSGSPTSICPGGSSTLSISGTLNDATAWYVYTGSCGGTLIGTTATSSFSVSPSVTTTYYVRGEGGCVTPGSCGTRTITVKPSYNLSETDYVCSGDSYTFPDGSTQSNITTQIIHNSNLQTTLLCDSIIQTTVNVYPVYNLSESDYVCSGDSYTFPDGTTQNNITSQVIHTSNLLTSHMCDSIIQTTINVRPVYNLSETSYVCAGDSYTFPDGTTQNNITAQVIHTSNLLTTNLCDSTIVTTINVYPSYNQSQTNYVCSGDSFTFPDGTTQNNITAQVIHTSNLLTIHLCDSIIVTTVNVYPTYNLSQTSYVCSGDSFTFPDGTTQNNITAQVIHTSNLQTTHTCDSIIVTTVNLYPDYNLGETDYVCNGDSYTFPDSTTQNNITAQIIHTSYLLTTHSCDSIIVTTVNVNPVYNLAETVYVCAGDSYTFPDGTTQNNITAQVIHTSNLLSISLCDSIIVSTVNVYPVYNLSETAYVCSGESFTFPDGTTQNNITSQTIYTSNLLTTHMCDSIIVTTVNVYPVYNQNETVYVCSGASHTFPDGSTQNNITAQVVYTSSFQTVHMCDSLIITTVNVYPVYDLSETDYVCEGDSYTFPDGTTQTNITSQVVYTSNLQTIHMCDSIIVTTVNVNPVHNVSETVFVCPNESYTFPDWTVFSNITEQVVHTSHLLTVSTLCDSIVVTTVNVNPVYNLNETVFVCPNGDYTFPDGSIQTNITSQIVYTSNLQTVGTLCDSTIVTTVNVSPVYNLSETVYVCSGDDYTFPDGTTQTEIISQIIYTSNLQTVGTLCDSTIVTTVEVNPGYYFSESFTICEGDNYTFPDGTTMTNIVSEVTYTSNLQTAGTLCDSIIETTINLNPVYNLAEAIYICPGGSYTFPDGTTHDNITSEFVYSSVFQMAGTLCDSIIETTVHLNPSYNLSETDNVCLGESYTFPDGFILDNIIEQVVHTSTFETVGTLCDSIIVTTVNVNVVDVSVTQNLHELTANAVSAEYQWLDCDNSNSPIDGETSQVFTATSNGSYAVEVTQNGCVDISECYDVTTINVSDIGFANNIRVYPNPGNGLINIDMGNVCREVKVIICDVLGQIVFESIYSSEQIITLQLDEAPGVYLMKVIDDEKETTVRLVKE